MTDYVPDVRKYTANVNEAAVAAIVKYCGVSLQRPDPRWCPPQTQRSWRPCATVSRPRSWD